MKAIGRLRFKLATIAGQNQRMVTKSDFAADTSRYLIRGGTVLEGPPRAGVFREADVIVDDGIIAGVEQPGVIEDLPVLDASGCYVLPGFVNTHHHLWETTMRGLTADGDLLAFIFHMRLMHLPLHEPEDVYAGTLAGALASLNTGTTTTIDHMHCVTSPDHAGESIRALGESGIRALWCYGLGSPGPHATALPTAQSRFDHARELRGQQFGPESNETLLTMGLALTDIGSQPWQATIDEVSLCRELGLPSTVHTNNLWGDGLAGGLALMHRLGLLDARQIHSHASNSTDLELELVRDAGASIAVTPETEMQMGIGIPILDRAQRVGCRAGLGSDIQANNSPDAFTQMRLAMHGATAAGNPAILESTGTQGLRGVALTCRDAYHAATLGAAETLFLEDRVGSIEMGKQADIILLRNDGLHQRPIVDHFSTIVQQSNVGDVWTVIVGGVIRKTEGRMPSTEAAAAIQLIDASFERLATKAKERGGLRPDVPLELIGMAMAEVRDHLSDTLDSHGAGG